MDKSYIKTLLDNLDCCTLERLTWFETGAEAVYRDGKLLCSDGDASDRESADLAERIVAKPHLVLFGGGHVGKALYDLAMLQGLDVTVLDSRKEVVSEERFPLARRICGRYEDLLSREYGSFVSPYYCIFTHGHEFDAQCLLYALRHRSSYIGMIGSKPKIARCIETVKKAGITDEKLLNLHSPIGLPINAVTPQEIAVAVMAQIISVFREDKSAVDLDSQVLSEASQNSGILVRIVEKTGSSPRSVGSSMFVTKSSFCGTVGGGAIENHAIERARRLISEKDDFIIERHELKEKDPLGMICGGSNTLLYKKVN
jgi:xanthine dehydrogenase accessory factor